MTQDQKGCKKNNVGAEEEQITTARTKQHEDEEGDTGMRPKKDGRQKPTGVLKNVMQEHQKGCSAKKMPGTWVHFRHPHFLRQKTWN